MTEWSPKIGDKVYCVCEYYTSDYTMRYKGLEGFRNYGLEVVESVVKSPYKWKSGGLGCVSVCLHREVGDNANNLFYWKKSDLGTRLFSTREEAAAVADVRAHNMDLGLWGKKYENRPMYKNWKHWGLNLPPVTKVNKFAPDTKKRKGFQPRPLPENFEEVYPKWRDGEYTNAQAAKLLNLPQTTFACVVKRELAKRGEKHSLKNCGARKPLPEGFNDVYEEWECGEISGAQAARQLGMEYTTFKYNAEKLFRKREAEGII